MADFGAWGPLELKITLGEAANLVVTAVLGLYIASILSKRQANQRASKDLVVDLCRESMERLSALSAALESVPATGVPDNRPVITRCVTQFSNSLFVIEVACEEAGLSPHSKGVEELKRQRELLRTQITDPLAAGAGFDPGALRQIDGTINTIRAALIKHQLAVNKL